MPWVVGAIGEDYSCRLKIDFFKKKGQISHVGVLFSISHVCVVNGLLYAGLSVLVPKDITTVVEKESEQCYKTLRLLLKRHDVSPKVF